MFQYVYQKHKVIGSKIELECTPPNHYLLMSGEAELNRRAAINPTGVRDGTEDN